jgi:hypothetical protein
MVGREASPGAQHILARLILAACPIDSSAAPAPVEGPLSQATGAVGPADWPAIAQTAAHEGLAPLLYASLKATGRLKEPPAEVRERLRQAYLLTDAANWLAYQELQRLLEAFAAQRVDTVLLKGCALAATLYAEPALRPMGDLDLLIRREALDRARQVMASQDYQPMQEMSDEFGGRYLQEQIFVRAGTRPAQVDVHWHLTSMPYYRARIPIEWFWDRAVEQNVNGRPALVFTPEAQLLHLSLHFALHHWSSRLLWSYDLALLLAQRGEQMDWTSLAGAAEAFGLGRAVRLTLENVRDRWGVSAPPEASARLASIRTRLPERALAAIMTARRREARVLSDGLSLPGLRPKLGYWLGLILPSREYMRRRYGVAQPALLPVYYARRVATGLWQLVRSTWSIALGLLRGRASN